MPSSLTKALTHLSAQASAYRHAHDKIWFGEQYNIADVVQDMPPGLPSEGLRKQLAEALEGCESLAAVAQAEAQELLASAIELVDRRVAAQAEYDRKAAEEDDRVGPNGPLGAYPSGPIPQVGTEGESSETFGQSAPMLPRTYTWHSSRRVTIPLSLSVVDSGQQAAVLPMMPSRRPSARVGAHEPLGLSWGALATAKEHLTSSARYTTVPHLGASVRSGC